MHRPGPAHWPDLRPQHDPDRKWSDVPHRVSKQPGPHQPQPVGTENPGLHSTTQSVYGIRIDQNIGTRHRLFGFWNSRENYTPGNPNFPFPIDTGPQVQDFYSKYFRGGWDYIISPSVMNEFVIGSN